MLAGIFSGDCIPPGLAGEVGEQGLSQIRYIAGIILKNSIKSFYD